MGKCLPLFEVMNMICAWDKFSKIITANNTCSFITAVCGQLIELGWQTLTSKI